MTEKLVKNDKTVKISIKDNNAEDHFPEELHGHFTRKEFSNRVSSINAALNKPYVSPTVKYYVPFGILINGIGAILIIAYLISSTNDSATTQRNFASALVAWTLAIFILTFVSLWVAYMMNKERKMRVQTLRELINYFNKIDYPREVYWHLLIEKANQKSLIIELNELRSDVVIIKPPNVMRSSVETDKTLIFDNSPFEDIYAEANNQISLQLENIEKASNQTAVLSVKKKEPQASIMLR